MPIRFFLFLIPALLMSQEIVIDSTVKIEMNQGEYDRAMRKYMESKYPEKLKAWEEMQRQKELKRQKELARQKELERQKEKVIRESTTTLNRLMWQDNQEAKNIKKDWQGAKEYCQGLKLAGFRDWRLPNIYELESIVDENRNPAIKSEFSNTAPYYYWSSSERQSSSDFAWFVNFLYGYSDGNDKTYKLHVRCVRAGQ
jgi:hypothetical protein